MTPGVYYFAAFFYYSHVSHEISLICLKLDAASFETNLTCLKKFLVAMVTTCFDPYTLKRPNLAVLLTSDGYKISHYCFHH